MEHGTFDLSGLDRFMQGLAAAHRESGTGTMVVELRVEGASAEILRANAWQVRQLLARGVHGLMLRHAECPTPSPHRSKPYGSAAAADEHTAVLGRAHAARGDGSS